MQVEQSNISKTSQVNADTILTLMYRVLLVLGREPGKLEHFSEKRLDKGEISQNECHDLACYLDFLHMVEQSLEIGQRREDRLNDSEHDPNYSLSHL
jgi:hypothetical protein